MRSKRKLSGKFTQAIMVIVLIAVCAGISIPLNFNDHTYTVTVTDKERVNSKDSSKYLVFCEDANTSDSLVFKNTDTLLRLKFDSSNIQGELKLNRKYTVTVVGYRIPFISSYENIIKVEENK